MHDARTWIGSTCCGSLNIHGALFGGSPTDGVDGVRNGVKPQPDVSSQPLELLADDRPCNCHSPATGGTHVGDLGLRPPDHLVLCNCASRVPTATPRPASRWTNTRGARPIPRGARPIPRSSYTVPHGPSSRRSPSKRHLSSSSTQKPDNQNSLPALPSRTNLVPAVDQKLHNVKVGLQLTTRVVGERIWRQWPYWCNPRRGDSRIYGLLWKVYQRGNCILQIFSHSLPVSHGNYEQNEAKESKLQPSQLLAPNYT